ncbi:MAG: VOC family protein [Novosphingobium sp.]|nr:VOC family protein [Novosphingobium sp.]
MMIQLDHVALAVRDLDAADRLLRERYGLGSVEGGAHPQWGTANRIVPLGPHFIEVVGVTDVALAASNPVGRIILEQTKDGDRFVGVCLNTDDKEGIARQIGSAWVEGSRDTAGGRLTFRSAGIERSIMEGAGWPYFFEYDDAGLRSGLGDPRHQITPLGIARVVLGQDAQRLRTYLGGDVERVVVEEGAPAFKALVIETRDGEICIPGLLA